MTTDQATRFGSAERGADGVTVAFERQFEAPAAKVWRALTEPGELAQWLADASVDLRIGGAIQVRFDDGVMNGTITELVPNELLSYTWLEGDGRESHVTWQLGAISDSATTLKLVHRRLAVESSSGFLGGWHHHLDRLEAVVGGSTMEWSWATYEELEEIYRARV